MVIYEMDNEVKYGKFHNKHGANIVFYEDQRVAHRKDSYHKGVVFTEQPLEIGSLFQLKILDKGGGWAGALRIGFTQHDPETGIPSGALDCYNNSHYWILSASTVHHDGKEHKMDFSIEELKVQDSIGCCITNEGELKYFVNGQDRGVGWKNVPTDRPLWGFADLYGLTRKVKSEFTFAQFMDCREDEDLQDVTG